MRRELIIEGQHMDLADKTSVTLEYVSNVLTGGSGKINLSKSYTIKLPKTLNNARILDDPGVPGHVSSRVRRFLSARYYQNGIDLLGPAQAYILKTTADSYELALIWNALPALQTLSESAKTLNDIEGLPVLPWIGSDGHAPDYSGETDGAGFAWYDSGLGANSYPDVNAAPHPYMNAGVLVRRILEQAGVPYRVSSERVSRALSAINLLAAPSHRPNREMEEASGSQCGNLYVLTNYDNALLFDVTAFGWDAPFRGTPLNNGTTGEDIKTLHVSAHFSVPSGTTMGEAYFIVQGLEAQGAATVRASEGEELARVYFADGSIDAELDVDMSGWDYFALNVVGVPGGLHLDGGLSVWRVHEDIQISFDNRFPIAENLPDLKQWEFVKACMVLAGAVPVIQNGELLMMGYDEAFDRAGAYDWTNKVTETDSIADTVSGWAQENTITYEREDIPLSFNPDATVRVDDQTIARSRELYRLPFAASQGSSAVHYEVAKDKEGALELETKDIRPRIWTIRTGADGRRELAFSEELYGDGLLSASYQELQGVMERPVVLSLGVRLDELDLATLDLRRPVYLRQYGHYYSIVKVQTSDNGVCKVELIQIP